MNRLWNGAACIVVAALVLLGAGPAAAERGEDGTLRLLLWQAPTMVNPYLEAGDKSKLASRIVYEPLASIDAEGGLVPVLAAEIPSLDNGGVAADGRSVTWKLKQGVRWADGEPFTVDDVLFTYEYVSNPEVGAANAASYEMVERVEVVDDHTLKVHFKETNPAWMRPFVGRNGMILPRNIFEPFNGPNAREAPANRLAEGTGPFRVTSFEEQDFLIIGEDIVNTIKITYDINPYYREPDKPYFGRVELRGGGDAGAAAEALFKDGSVDFAWQLRLDIAALEAFEALGKARLVTPPSADVERIMLNFSDPNRATEDDERSSMQFPHAILSDPRVRKALALSIDREAISALYGRAGPITANLLTEPKIYASPNTTWAYDLEQGAALLDEAGWVDRDGDGIRDKDGRPLSLLFQTSVNPLRQRVQDIVRDSLAEIGVEIELKIIDASVFFGPVAESTNTAAQFYADLEMYARGNQNPEPDNYMGFWLCDEIAQKANNWTRQNHSRYCNPAYDALHQLARRELDPDKRRALFIAMNDLLTEDIAVIPLLKSRTFSGLRNDIDPGRDFAAWDEQFWDIANWRRRP